MKKCLIYARTSTSDQECRNQISQLQEYAHKQSWQVVDVIEDVCSGGKSVRERTGLKRAFEMAHRREYDVLLFWSLDRLSREGTRQTINYLTTLESDGVDWHSFTEEYLSSLGIFKDCIISLLSCLARQEKIRIGERTKAGLERTVRVNGTRLGRPRTSPDAVSNARRLKENGLSYAQIAGRLNISRSRAYQLVKAA